MVLNNLVSKQSVKEIWPVYVILQEKKFNEKVLQKLQFQVLRCFQRIKHNFYWKMKVLKHATYSRYVIAKLSKLVEI